MSYRSIRGSAGENFIGDLYDQIGHKKIEVIGKKGNATDIQSEYGNKLYFTSVKKRYFRIQTIESDVQVFNEEHIQKLIEEAKRKNAIPLLAFILKYEENRNVEIHIFIWTISDIFRLLDKTKKGYVIRFGEKRRSEFYNIQKNSKFYFNYCEPSSKSKEIMWNGLLD